MNLLIGLIFLLIILIMVIKLTLKTQDSKHEYERKSEKMKAEVEYLQMKHAAKLSYAEKQRLNFARGKHWKR